MLLDGHGDNEATAIGWPALERAASRNAVR